MHDPLAEARALFDPAPGLVYLDSATYGLPPRPTVEAVQQALSAWQAGTADWVRDWDQRGEDCRASFARLIGAEPSSIALQPTVSVGVSTIAATLKSTDEVLISDDEFVSVVYPVLVAARERGATVRSVAFNDLASAVRGDTTLVAFSLVQSQSGRGAALRDILAACRAHGALSLIDATHAVPFVPLAPEINDVDYLVCAAYKHLLSPRGVAFMYVAPEHRDNLLPIQANWRSSSQPYGSFYGPPLDLAPDAARFDVSLAWHAWVGAAQSLQLLADWQQRGVIEEARGLACRLARSLELPEPLGAVVSAPVDDADAVRDRLAEQGIRAAVRAGSVRLSPHVYNTVEHIDKAAAALAPFVRVPAAR